MIKQHNSYPYEHSKIYKSIPVEESLNLLVEIRTLMAVGEGASHHKVSVVREVKFECVDQFQLA